MNDQPAVQYGSTTGQREDEDFRLKIMPVSCLSLAKDEILGFCEKCNLSAFEKKTYIDGSMLDLPELSFQPISIIVIIAKMGLKTAVFHRDGKQVTNLFRVREISIEDYLNDRFTKRGYHLENARTLPQKRLAVGAGLVKYGKNNLTYADGWGSFIQLETYLSDAPCTEGFVWGEVKNMEQCESCGACARLCPGGAITEDRFLLDINRCHGWLDVIGKLPETAAHTIGPCMVCQTNCPKNSRWRMEAATVVFSEQETAQLMSIHGMPKNTFPLSSEETGKLLSDMGLSKECIDKLFMLNIYPWTLKDIPHKLRHMFTYSAVSM
ncbi:MAG: 4Fe-4S binding protein [Clostridiales bacterium]|jgi:epoxyqueuosine reductase|nr:4Fe-4S binding protein [Clostridiales bacterium]